MRWLFALLAFVSFNVAAQEGATTPPIVNATDDSGPQALTGDMLKEVEAYWTTEQDQTPEAAKARTLDIRQCVDLTLAQNPQVFVAQDDVDAAKAKIGQAQSQRKPQVKAQEGIVYLDGLKPFSIPIIGGNLTGEKTERKDEFTLTQVLYAGGQINAAIKASEYLAQAQEWRKQAKLNELEFSAKNAYNDCLLARAMVRVAEESVVTFQKHLTDAQQMLDVGLISNFEVLRAKTEMGAREADVVAAKNAVRLTLVNLHRILALPQDTSIQLVSKMEWAPISEPLADLLSEANTKRPELLALEKGIAAAGENIHRIKGEYLPRAAATADWSNTSGAGQMQPNGWTLSLGAQWDIYAGGKRKHEVAEGKAQKSGLEHQLEDVRRLIELDVRQAHIQMQDTMARITKEKGTVDLGREGLRLAQLRFQEGVGTQSEVLDAQLALTSAETMLVKAVHDYALAHAAIEKATARTWVQDKNPHQP